MTDRICTTPGCTTEVQARGLCHRCYEYKRVHGLIQKLPPKIPEKCSILDCPKDALAKGYCDQHYGNLHKYGHAVALRDWPLLGRIAQTGWTVTERGCWEWNGKRHEHGYGIIDAYRLGLKNARVHRIVWEMTNGPIDDPNLVVRHRCDNPPCVNPDHLELGTLRDNSLDMSDRGRGVAYATGRYDGVCKQGRHDVSRPGALKVIRTRGRKSYYSCVECDRERKAKYQAKRKAS